MSDQNELLRTAVPLLQGWYASCRRELPWREVKNAYHIWISEIMLQQTRIAAVLEYYDRFLKALPDIPALAAVPEDELMKLWQGLGYYSRARNLRKTAQILTEQYGGQFPADHDAIRALPGIGDYTAGAIASIAFGLPAPAVDGNVLRVLTRLTADGRDISRESTKADFRARLAGVIPPDAPGEFNEALMELGETVCLPNGAPLCDLCPLRALCRARSEGLTEELPFKAQAKARRIEERKVFLLFYKNRVALRKRAEKGLLAGLWEFPNALRAEEDPLAREGIAVTAPPASCGKGKHVFSHIEWHMEGFIAEAAGPELPESWVWADRDELEHVYAVPNAFRFALEKAEEFMVS